MSYFTDRTNFTIEYLKRKLQSEFKCNYSSDSYLYPLFGISIKECGRLNDAFNLIINHMLTKKLTRDNTIIKDFFIRKFGDKSINCIIYYERISK